METRARFGYADPPYPGMAHYYPEKTEVDHSRLVARLEAEYPEGWALCTASTTLREVLALCPPDVRIGAWVKPFCSWKPSQRVAYTWEPVIWRGGVGKTSMNQPTVRDHLAANITLQKGLVGAKPPAFNQWVLDLLGAGPGDVIDDLYPGTGGMARALARISRTTQGRLIA